MSLFLCNPYNDPQFTSTSGDLVTQWCPTLATPWTVALQAPLSMGFPKQEYWSGLPFSSSPGDLSDPGTKPRSNPCLGRRGLYPWTTLEPLWWESRPSWFWREAEAPSVNTYWRSTFWVVQVKPGPPVAPGQASPLRVHKFVYSYRPSCSHRGEPGSPPYTGLLLQGTGTWECFLKVSCCPKVPVASGCFYLDLRIAQRAFSQEPGGDGHLYLCSRERKIKQAIQQQQQKPLQVL